MAHTFESSIMPRSTIRNIAKEVLKPDTIIQKDALSALTRSSTVFVSYLTAHANDLAIQRNRKTIMPLDVLDALKQIEFDRFVPPLKEEWEQRVAEGKSKRDKVVDESGPSKKVKLDEEVGTIQDEPEEEEEEADEEIENDEGDVDEEEADEEDADEEEEEQPIPDPIDQLEGETLERQDTYDEALDNGEDSD